MKLFFKNVKAWFDKQVVVVKILIIGAIGLGLFFGGKNLFGTKKATIQYQTDTVTKDTLVVSLSESGVVSTANNAIISTQATGVVSKLYVKDGDAVKSGDKIAEIDLDMVGKQTAAQALSSYQSAKNNLDSAQANMYSLQSTMFSDWDTFMKIAQNGTYQNEDGTPNNINRSLPEFHIANDNWLAAEAKYKIQQNVVNQAQTALNSAWLSYQQASSTVYAPISGTVSGLSLQVGSVISSNNTSTTNNTQSSTKIANVKTEAPPSITVNISEIDIPKVKIGNRASITLDAFPDKTFTGKVISIDTNGTTTSGVTTYPTVILLDTDPTTILPNMAASANIITATKSDVLIVPSSAVTTQNGATVVQVMKNGVPQYTQVVTGISSDTQTEIVSGVKEGDTVVTGTVSTATAATTGTSVFSTFGGARNSGAVRVGR